tara:strand:+ start:55 stop:498 length:444 start_codon:yes stop_codon:yes gene_type:complete
MAQIISYPLATPVSTDYVVGTQKSTTGAPINPTKNFTVDSVVSAGLGYTVYTALLTQTGNNAPSATILKNNTNATLTWSRVASGDYNVTASSNLFTNNKTLVFVNAGSHSNTHNVYWERVSDTVVKIKTHNTDDDLTNASFEVRIYS